MEWWTWLSLTDLRKNLMLTWLWDVRRSSVPLLLGHSGIWENYSNLLVIPYHHCWDAKTFQYHILCWEPLLEWVLQSALHRGSTENISRLFTETSSNLYSVSSAAQCAATLSTSAPLQVYMTRILVTKYHLMKKRSTFYNHNSLSFSTVLVEWYRPDWLNCGSHNCHFSSLWL